jgi:uncharacterized protein
MMVLARWLVVIALILSGAPVRAEPIAVPPLQARVTDQTHTLSDSARQAIEARLADLEARKGSQLAVLVLPSTGPETIEQFGIRVAERWQLGRKGVDDGALLLIAKDDRTLRIEVGYGLEGAIPDAVAKRVIEEVIVPRFKAGDFEGGIAAGVAALIGLIDGEPLPAPAGSPSGPLSSATLDDLFPVAMLLIFGLGGLMRAIFGRLLGASVSAGVAFVAAWWIAGVFLVALVLALIVFVITLAGGGGRIGGGGGWSSGGGGYSGGGGGFGGGGASGRW